MIHYLILAEGGCYGNFLACLIRSMWDLNFTKNKEFTKSGSCDFISCANSVSILINDNYKNTGLYPETSRVADLITEVLKTKEYTKKMFRYEMDFNHLNTFHYLDKNNINKFLTVKDVKIIYVIMELDDSDLIALNKISKNFDNDFPLELVKNVFRNTVKNNIEEYDKLTDFDTMSDNLKKELISDFSDKMKKRSLLPLPDNTERILFLKFKDVINDKDKILKDLSTFTNSKVNETTIDFYQRYLNKQPTMKSVYNLIGYHE